MTLQLQKEYIFSYALCYEKKADWHVLFIWLRNWRLESNQTPKFLHFIDFSTIAS